MHRRLLLTFPAIAIALACLPQCKAGAGGGDRAPVTCDEGRGATTPRDRFTRFTIESAADGPGFVAAGDVNGDGKLDLVVSSLGHPVIDPNGGTVTLARGHVEAYLQGGALGCWEREEIVPASAGMYFTNRPTLADVDGDGDLDVVQPAGFFVCQFDQGVRKCGALAWFENGAGWKRHDVVPAGDERFYHSAVLVDFDGDGTKDLVTVGEKTSGPTAMWFKGNASPDRFDPAPLVMGDALGSFPAVLDLDGDGDLDVAAGEYFVIGETFAWLERTGAPSAAAPAGTWAKHVIDADDGRGFELAPVPNLYGDGVTRLVGTNHTNALDDPQHPIESSVFVFDVAGAGGAWDKTRISSGILSRPSQGTAVQGAPGVFGAGDVDGDGDVDLALAGDGDPRTFWMEQTSRGQFAMHVVEDRLGQASGALIVDLDGDGASEIVFTGYEDDAVYVYAHAK